MTRPKTLALAAALLAGAAAAPAAQAQSTPPYDLQAVCGSSYGFVDELPQAVKGSQVGLTVLAYSAATKKNCAVTFKTRQLGKPTLTTVSLRKQGGRYKTDRGRFKYYAGPVYVKAPGVCVQFGGTLTLPVGYAQSFSPFGHCG